MPKNQTRAESHKTHYYRAFGLNIHSDVHLPELIAVPAQGQADVQIRYGQSTDDITLPESQSRHFAATPEQVVLRADGFLIAVADGNKITIYCGDPASYQGAIRLRILGAGMGLLLQQREHLVLHGATIVGKLGAVVIMGNSGDGKSTLTIQLAEQGYRLSGDDKCVMSIDENEICALPGSPFIKVSDRLVKQTGIDNNIIHSVCALKNKVYVDLSANFEKDTVPIVAGFVLGRAEETSVRKLTQRQTFDRLIENSYRKKKLFKAGLQKTQFLHCHRVANSVPVYQYSRPLTGDYLQQPEPRFLDLLKDLIGSGR